MPAYQQPVEQVVAVLGTDARRGLSDDEARTRLERHGRNELAADPPVAAWRKFLAQFQNVLVILLLVATAISAGLWLYERDSGLAQVIGLQGDGEAVVLPLLATQLLWINLVTDGAPALALGVDPADPGLMNAPPRSKSEGVITRQILM